MDTDNNPQNMPKQPKHAGASTTTKKRSSTALLIVGIALVCIAVAIVAFILVSQYQLQLAQQAYESADTATLVEETSVPENTVEPIENPVNFTELQAENSDIYSWLYVPGTNINYPVFQSAEDDNYYLTHNEDGVVSIEGALFTQSCNKKDYSDPVTVIYGHNIYNPQMMFYQLHFFEDQQFFEDYDTFYIYAPGHVFTYQVIAAYDYDNRHIMNSFDFTQKSVVKEYFASILNPDSLNAIVRSGATLTENDKVVQLSTCLDSGNPSGRFIVTGKLISDQPTY